MESIKKYSYPHLIQQLVGKKVRFTSDCEFFPNFDITGLVMSYYLRKNNEIVFKTKIDDKIIDVGGNMKNLQFEIK